MPFKDIDQILIDKCSQNTINIEEIKNIISTGANVNAFNEDFEQELYDAILDYYIDEEQPNLSNLREITKLFLQNDLILNHKPEDNDYFLPRRFRFLPPEEICVDIFKLLLEKGCFSFEDLDGIITDATLDLHLGEFYFYEDTQYTKEDSINYYLELIYWACAYNVKTYPEKCEKDVLSFEWFNRNKNKVDMVCENRSTSVFVEDLETHVRIEIGGWSMKY